MWRLGLLLVHSGPGPVIVSITFMPAARTRLTAASTAAKSYLGSLGLDGLKPAGCLLELSDGATRFHCTNIRTVSMPSAFHAATACPACWGGP